MIGWGASACCLLQGESGYSEVRVYGCEGEPSAGEVAGVEPCAEKDAGCEVGADAAGAVHADRASSRCCGDFAQPAPELKVGDIERAGQVAFGELGC
jgi:hypothetical protein